MSNPPKSAGLKGSKKARWTFRAIWLIVSVGPILTIVLIANASTDRLDDFGKLGLVQPSVAALIALAVVMSMRLTWGRFANQRRKGVSSASSSAIAVRLWAVCFALLVGAMLLSALVTRLPTDLLRRADHPSKTFVKRIEVKPAGAASAATYSVTVTH